VGDWEVGVPNFGRWFKIWCQLQGVEGPDHHPLRLTHWTQIRGNLLRLLDYQVLGQCWSLTTSCYRCQSQLPSLKLHFSWFGLPYLTALPLTTLWKTTTRNCRHTMSVSGGYCEYTLL